MAAGPSGCAGRGRSSKRLFPTLLAEILLKKKKKKQRYILRYRVIRYRSWVGVGMETQGYPAQADVPGEPSRAWARDAHFRTE